MATATKETGILLTQEEISVITQALSLAHDHWSKPRTLMSIDNQPFTVSLLPCEIEGIAFLKRLHSQFKELLHSTITPTDELPPVIE